VLIKNLHVNHNVFMLIFAKQFNQLFTLNKIIMTTNVMWFSRHEMTDDQKNSLVNKLGEITVTMVNGTAPNVHVPFEAEVNGNPKTQVKPLKEWVNDFDVVAVVAPIGLLQQIVGVTDKPVIQALNKRVMLEGEKMEFVFEKWERIVKVEIVKEDF
jgi:hypothetical protein